ncbi:ABC transporter ATP-binding protein [uncultured Cetobacterium sp.]|uniref:ABC transporter ATP-binding protein n=1 Tax=uncultured Cetobacterium sp. TaxID=527638 RepID=UPI00261B804D|nr:ABC transporter ATP-binding protein [uncultured Cetobacterium sp.]
MENKLNKNFLQLKNINKYYNDSFHILKNINIEILQGEFVGIIGKSGSGKTTLLNLIGGLDFPDSGKILYKGEDITEYNKNKKCKFRNEHIGFIFQFHFLLKELNVLENILVPSWIKSRYSNIEAQEKAEKYLELMDLKDFSNRKITEISGGQQQIISIIRSLINNPSIILADEPTGNLDSNSAKKIYSLLRKINKEYNITFIIVTHDNEFASLCDRIIEIKDGKIKSLERPLYED